MGEQTLKVATSTTQIMAGIRLLLKVVEWEGSQLPSKNGARVRGGPLKDITNVMVPKPIIEKRKTLG